MRGHLAFELLKTLVEQHLCINTSLGWLCCRAFLSGARIYLISESEEQELLVQKIQSALQKILSCTNAEPLVCSVTSTNDSAAHLALRRSIDIRIENRE
jgi:hypothetical protein